LWTSKITAAVIFAAAAAMLSSAPIVHNLAGQLLDWRANGHPQSDLSFIIG
jgi:hypothetical protein